MWCLRFWIFVEGTVGLRKLKKMSEKSRALSQLLWQWYGDEKEREDPAFILEV
jgi:hypothetical protein